MNRFFIVIVLMLTSGSAMAGVNWFVVATSDLGKSTVVEVYGWNDNKTPCMSIAKAMNIMLEADGYNPIGKHFTCIDQKMADKLDTNNPLSMRKVKIRFLPTWLNL